MSDNEQPVAPSTSTPHDETRGYRKPVDGPPAKLRVEADTPNELLAAVAKLTGMRYVIAAGSWGELIHNAAQQAPQGDLVKPIVSRLSNAAAVARQAGF